MSNRIEIWDRETWNDFYEESENSFEDIAEDLIDFDFKWRYSSVSSRQRHVKRNH